MKVGISHKAIAAAGIIFFSSWAGLGVAQQSNTAGQTDYSAQDLQRVVNEAGASVAEAMATADQAIESAEAAAQQAVVSVEEAALLAPDADGGQLVCEMEAAEGSARTPECADDDDR